MLEGIPSNVFLKIILRFLEQSTTRGELGTTCCRGPKARTETARKSFYFNGSKLFNNIASEMKDSKSVVIFKTRILELYRSKVF